MQLVLVPDRLGKIHTVDASRNEPTEVYAAFEKAMLEGQQPQQVQSASPQSQHKEKHDSNNPGAALLVVSDSRSP